MKRGRSWDASKGGFQKKRRLYPKQPLPVTISGPSMRVRPYVPLSNRGYRPNAIEKKVYDVGPTSKACTTTGTVTALFLPTLGSDMQNRVGRKACIEKIFFRGFITLEAASDTLSGCTSESQAARIMLVWDTQPNGSIAAIGDILKDPGNATQSQLNMDYRDRFKVIWEKNFTFDPLIIPGGAVNASLMNRTCYFFKKYRKVNLETIFNSTNGGTIADIASGALLLVTVGTVAAGADKNSNLFFSNRIRFSDPN